MVKQKFILSAVLGAVVSTVPLVTPTILHAQGALEEIVVTAQRREQSLQDVPISLEVVSGETLLDQGFRDMTMLQSFTPNLDIRLSDSADQNSTKMRGVGTVGDNYGFEQAVPMFIDGVHYGRGTQITSAFLDIDRIEILRGPQPVYFGQNATAGAISLSTRKPTPEWEGFLNTEYGSNNTKSLELAGGGPLTDTLGIRAAGQYESTDGYMKSVWHGGRFPGLETYVGRITLAWNPTDALQVTPKLEYMDLTRDTGVGSSLIKTEGDRDCNNDLGMCITNDPAAFDVSPAYPIPTGDFTNIGSGTGPPYWAVQPEYNIRRSRGSRAALNIVPLMQDPPADLDLRRTDLDYSALEEIDTATASIDISYQFGNGMTLTSNTAYIDFDRRGRDNQPGDNGPFPIRKTDKWEEVDQWNQELRLESPAGGFLEWMGGVYWQQQNLDLNQVSMRATASIGDYEEGFSFQDSTWTSGFASVTVNPTDQISVDLGGRYTDVHKEAGLTPFISDGWICDNGTPEGELCDDDVDAYAGTVPIGLAPIVQKFDTIAQDYDTSDFNWQVVVRWRPSDTVSTFAKYANSFKAGGFDFGKTLFRPGHVNSFKFEDEFVDAWEVGVKGDFLDGRANYEVTAFWSEFTDLQLSAFDPVLEIQRAQNVAEQRARGVEMRSSILLGDRWQLNLSGALLDSKMVSFPGAICTEVEIDQDLCLDLETGLPDEGGRIDRTGQEAPRSPDWQIVANSNYWLPVWDQYKLSLNGQLSISDAYVLDDGFSKIVSMPSYADLNLKLGFGPQDDLWTVSVYGRNLTEPLPEYYAENDLAPDGLATANTTRSMFRTFGVQFRYNFR